MLKSDLIRVQTTKGDFFGLLGFPFPHRQREVSWAMKPKPKSKSKVDRSFRLKRRMFNKERERKKKGEEIRKRDKLSRCSLSIVDFGRPKDSPNFKTAPTVSNTHS